METGMNTLQRINKIYNNTLTVSTLPDVKKFIFWDDPLFATFAESRLMFIFLFFCIKFFVSLLLHFHRLVFDQDFIFKLNSKLNTFNVKK